MVVAKRGKVVVQHQREPEHGFFAGDVCLISGDPDHSVRNVVTTHDPANNRPDNLHQVADTDHGEIHEHILSHPIHRLTLTRISMAEQLDEDASQAVA